MYFIAGIFITSFWALCVKYAMEKIRDDRAYIPPAGILAEKWENVFKLSAQEKKHTIILGFMESYLAFLSFWINKPEVIGIWLGFKVASKWECWNTIIKLPERIDSIDPLEYVGAKNRIATYTLQRWLIGTLANISAGFLGMKIARFFQGYLLQNNLM